MSTRWITAVVRRVTGLVHRGPREQRLDSEMQFHLEMLTERYMRAGHSPDDARRLAGASFGGVERFKDDARDEYRSRTVDALGQDLRYAIRTLRRNGPYTIAATLTFALGIGATGAIFSVVHGVLFRPLPYAAPDRLVTLWERNDARGRDRNVVSVPTFEAWRERTRSFDRMAGLVPLPATIDIDGAVDHVTGAEVSPGFFSILRAAPALGRVFTPEEEQGGGANVLVLSDGFWRSRFGADPAVIGRIMRLDGHPYTIVGVMRPDFEPPAYGWMGAQPYWKPFAPTESNRGWGRFLHVIARLAPGVTEAVARQELVTVAADLAREVPANAGWSATLVPLRDQITGDVRLPLLVLSGAVGLLLLISIANVANLTLGLMRRRGHELAVRRAMGATAGRLVQQIMTQSAVVGAIGGALGLGAAAAGVRVLVSMLPAQVPRGDAIRLDGRIVAFTVAISVLAALAIGAVAALRGGRADATAMRESGGGRSAARLRGGGLVAAEVALGLVLTVLAGLTARSFVALRAVQLGFQSEHVLAARVGVAGERYGTPEQRRAFFDDLLARVRAIPGVAAASAVSTRPFYGGGPATTLGDAATGAAGDSLVADVRFTDAQLFQTLRVPLVAGTTFDARDRVGAPPRVIINETLARALWPGRSALGERLRMPMFNGISPEVIGVVGDMHLADARTPVRGTAYLSDHWLPVEIRDLIVRTEGDGEAILPALRAAVHDLDAGVPVYEASSLDALADRAIAGDRFIAELLGAFAAVALVLAAVGIYGVFAADVTQRRKEIGIRVALGAPAGGVLRLVMRRALTLALLGIAIGVVGALAAARSMRALLYGVGSADPASYAGVAVLLLLVAVAATLGPALRATRVSPLVAIRTD